MYVLFYDLKYKLDESINIANFVTSVMAGWCWDTNDGKRRIEMIGRILLYFEHVSSCNFSKTLSYYDHLIINEHQNN